MPPEPPTPTRRTFLRASTAAALLLSAPASAADDAVIIDTHQHLWDLSKFKLPWVERAAPVLRQSHRTEDYREATRGLNVRAVYMEVDMPPEERAAEAEYAIALCRAKTNPTVAAVIGGRPDAPDFEQYVNRFKPSGFVRGVRNVLHSAATPRGTCLADDFVRGIHFLGKNDLSFDLCVRPAELPDALKLAELCPDTRLILDHCGNADPKAFAPGAAKPSHDPDAWKRDTDALGKRPNVVCKISGIVASAPEKWSPDDLAPVVNHCFDAFGPDRVVFGGDWPVCLKRATLLEWVAALRTIVKVRSEADRLKLWSANAARLYSI